jgi:ribonucleoside-diphosphate reductase alpha chain
MIFNLLKKDMKIKSIKNGKLIPTADFEVPGSHAYYMENGIVSHNTSIYQDASASILPVYDAFFTEDDKAGRNVTVARFLSKNPIGYAQNQSQFDPNDIINVTSEAQKFIDTGCSMELIFDQNKPDFNAKDLYDTIMYAYDKKLKSVYYIRSIKKNESIVAKEDAACVGCAG